MRRTVCFVLDHVMSLSFVVVVVVVDLVAVVTIVFASARSRQVAVVVAACLFCRTPPFYVASSLDSPLPFPLPFLYPSFYVCTCRLVKSPCLGW